MAEAKVTAPGSTGTNEFGDLREAQLAHEGMKLILCSKLTDAERFFSKYRKLSPRLHAGYSFSLFIKAVMNFEDDDLETAYNMLESTEKFCNVEAGIFSSSEKKEKVSKLAPHEKLLRRSIIADCLLLEAVTVFLRQSVASYVKGGYIIRKAWKQYESIVRDMEKLCSTPSPLKLDLSNQLVSARSLGGSREEELESHASSTNDRDVPPDVSNGLIPSTGNGKGSPIEDQPTTLNSNGEGPCSESKDGNKLGKDQSVESLDSLSQISLNSPIQYLDHPDNQLRASVYFGFGMMNVSLSLIPPKLLKLANLLGFRGNRSLGLQALEFCSQSQDMKAPLARLFLLWYHTIIRHFFALDGNQNAGCSEALRLLEDSLKYYPTSAIFLYFRGKVHYLEGQLEEALAAYDHAASSCKGQQEVEHICLYEKGWVHFLRLEWQQAFPCYTRLKDETRWSACYYCYLAAILAGMSGDLDESLKLFLQCCKLVKRKNNLEKFCSRRASIYKKGKTGCMSTEVFLQAVEVIYLWRALPCCSTENKEEILTMLQNLNMSGCKTFHTCLKALLCGSILVDCAQYEEAERCLREVLNFESELKNDKHIPAFALYEMAIIRIKQEQYSKASRLLHQAKEAYGGYEFEARLNFKVHSTLTALEEDGKI